MHFKEVTKACMIKHSSYTNTTNTINNYYGIDATIEQIMHSWYIQQATYLCCIQEDSNIMVLILISYT